MALSQPISVAYSCHKRAQHRRNSRPSTSKEQITVRPLHCRPLLMMLLVLQSYAVVGAGKARIGSTGKISMVRMPTPLSHSEKPLRVRGGSSFALAEAKENDDEGEYNDGDDQSSSDVRRHPDFAKLQAYRMKQQVLLQLRATLLSEALALRGIPLPTLREISTPQGVRIPEKIDWDCALATREEPYNCLYARSAEEGTKVIAPIGETDRLDGSWIGVASLNRLRRKDPSKVDTMWHNKYTALSSWFDPDSEFSIYQHVGIKGLMLNSLLEGSRLSIVMGLLLGMTIIIIMPVLEIIASRVLVSPLVWKNWPTWTRYVRAPLPFKVAVTQYAAKVLFGLFQSVVEEVKNQLVEWECQILEDNIPMTVGSAVEKEHKLDDELDEEMGGILRNDENDEEDEDE